jgi:predicted NBD/HSP70 family sugar kinase
MKPTAHRALALHRQGAVAVLRYVHDHPAATRAAVVRALGLSSGSAADITARLKEQRLLDETDSPPTGGRGRPSPTLVPHPLGPLVCAVDISHERWRVAVTELGGGVVEDVSGRHANRRADAVVGELRDRVHTLHRRYARRLRAVSVAVAGTVQGTDVIQASTLQWRDVSLDALRPTSSTPLLVGNDATLAGLAEARRGVGTGARVALHVTVEVGVGGVLVVDDVPMDGTTGAGGEFGHLPFGDPALQCPCGAYGCWDLEVDGRALARHLGQPPPRNPRTTAERIIAAASTDPAARTAVNAVARALGRGIGGLVNALDPDLVSLSGLAVELSTAAPTEFRGAYHAGLMRFRRTSPPPLLPSVLGPGSQLAGAAEIGFDTLLTPDGLEAWSKVPAGT